MPRIILTEVEVTFKRVRRADLACYPHIFVHEGADAAVDKAKTNTLTGWEPYGEPEYRAVSSREVESAPNVDAIV
ncbi:hypothetical protein [Bradyrhizobium sp. SHOUNA76]|uniref:hypothetical protein n=1 Tax=Bradyrhizobium sp. SHOUNA76 TaxID=2908927 RepID=UPI001FF556A9|nr:hypothetical protein [Bradyrhizobium sp. SHOUNA76]MCJ9700197.1 hypothetical protein [Bradyrhizobium sp. SHOUNA76]